MQFSWVKGFAFGALVTAALFAPLAVFSPAWAETKIVAIGASNTSGFGAGFGQSLSFAVGSDAEGAWL